MAVATATIIAGIGLALGAAGAATSYVGSVRSAKAQKKQEGLRQKQMNLDLIRRRREAVRQMLAAKAAGISNATSQGVAGTDSAVIGGISQSTQSGNTAMTSLEQSQDIGNQSFAYAAQESSGRGISSMGTAIQGWGSGLVSNSQTISRVGQSYGLWGASYGGAI